MNPIFTDSTVLNSAVGVKLSAATADTLRFLGEQAGKIIEATVVQAVPSSSSTKNSAAPSSSLSSQLTQNAPQHPSSDRNPTDNQYLVKLKVDNQQIQVIASQLPRIGQRLLLEVVDYKTLTILNATTTVSGGTQTLTANLPRDSVETNRSAPQLHRDPNGPSAQVAAVQKGLTHALPRQFSKTELLHALRQLLGHSAERPQTPTAANSRATVGVANASTISHSATTTANLTANKDNFGRTQIGSGTTASTNPISPLPNTVDHNAQTHRGIPPIPNFANNNVTNHTTTKNIARNLLPTALTQRINAIENTLPTLKELKNPESLKTTLQNSGLFYEKKLLDIAQLNKSTLQSLRSNNTTANTAAGNSVRSDTQRNINNNINGVINNNSGSGVPKRENTQPTLLGEALKKDLDRQLSSDLKYQLLSLAFQIKKTLVHSTPSSLNMRPETPTAALPGYLLPESALHHLLDALNSGTTNTANTATNSTESLDAFSQLLRFALGGINRTQVQQFQALGSQIAAGSENSVSQSLATEVPFLHDGKLSILDIAIERETQKKQHKAKPNAWNVRLRFDLDELGELAALCTLQDKTIAAVFWVSAEPLAAKLRQEFPEFNSGLNDLGLNVKHLHCQVGEPDREQFATPINLFNTNLLDELT